MPGTSRVTRWMQASAQGGEPTMATLDKSRLLSEGLQEHWRPPPLADRSGLCGQLSCALRRFLDVQNGSIWSDLAKLLPGVHGCVVDVGCGAQPYRGLLPADVRYIGIDTADAKAHFGYEMPDTKYFSGDAWPLESGTADAILCTEALEHVATPATFLAEAARCLRGGGALYLTVPFAARWHFIPHDFWRYTPSGLSRLLSGAGFVDVRIYARGNACTVACYKAMALILPLLAAQGATLPVSVMMRLLGLICSPLLLALAVIANVSLRRRGGADCLGYTVLATRDALPARSDPSR